MRNKNIKDKVRDVVVALTLFYLTIGVMENNMNFFYWKVMNEVFYVITSLFVVLASFLPKYDED